MRSYPSGQWVTSQLGLSNRDQRFEPLNSKNCRIYSYKLLASTSPQSNCQKRNPAVPQSRIPPPLHREMGKSQVRTDLRSWISVKSGSQEDTWLLWERCERWSIYPFCLERYHNPLGNMTKSIQPGPFSAPTVGALIRIHRIVGRCNAIGHIGTPCLSDLLNPTLRRHCANLNSNPTLPRNPRRRFGALLAL